MIDSKSFQFIFENLKINFNSVLRFKTFNNLFEVEIDFNE
jgi:hypothetical protein